MNRVQTNKAVSGFFFRATAALLICFAFACAQESVQHQERTVPEPDPALNRTARYLAGLYEPDPETGSISTGAAYERHRIRMKELMASFEANHASAIRSWKNKNYSTENIDLILYMFSGVDLLNVSLWYPEADTYLMVSLEDPGGRIDILKMSEDQRTRALDGLYGSIATLSRYNYLMTRTMRWQLSNNPVRGVIGPLLAQLALQEREILSLERLKLNEKGQLVESGSISKYIPPGQLQRSQRRADFAPEAIRIRFIEKDTRKPKQLIFLRLWISDELLIQNTRTLLFFDQLPEFAYMLKSASYYMHRLQSEKLGRFLAGRAVSGNQDDSGIPYRYFDRKVDLYGRYIQAARLGDQPFHPDQPGLKAAYDAQKNQPLPFVYGYGKIQGMSNLQIIRPK